MALDFGIIVEGLDDVQKAFTRLPQELDKAEENTVRRASLEALAQFRRNVSGIILRRRTASYVSSTNAADPSKDDKGWKSEVGVKKGPASAYAAVHEGDEAGNPITIRPKRAKLLAIPVGDALTPAGVPRYGSPRDVPESMDATWIKTRTGRFLFVARDENDEINVLFIGKEQVTIPARRPLGKTKEYIAPRLKPLGETEIGKAIARAGF